MKRIAIQGFLVACLLWSGSSARAQDKPTKDEAKVAPAHQYGPQLKVQVVFSEYEGDKKIKSLPYTLLVLVGGDTSWGRIRMGDKVPVVTGAEGTAVQYYDVGTNIDCRAFAENDGRYRLSMTLERSWVETGAPFGLAKDTVAGGHQIQEPTIRQFRSESNLLLRDGQAIDTNFATDPTSGKVVKLEVSMTVLK